MPEIFRYTCGCVLLIAFQVDNSMRSHICEAREWKYRSEGEDFDFQWLDTLSITIENTHVFGMVKFNEQPSWTGMGIFGIRGEMNANEQRPQHTQMTNEPWNNWQTGDVWLWIQTQTFSLSSTELRWSRFNIWCRVIAFERVFLRWPFSMTNHAKPIQLVSTWHGSNAIRAVTHMRSSRIHSQTIASW